MPTRSNRLALVLVMVLVLVLVVVLPLILVLVLVIFGFRIKTSNDWGMLIPLNLQGLLREAPRKSTTVSIAKETGSLKLRSGADHLPF